MYNYTDGLIQPFENYWSVTLLTFPIEFTHATIRVHLAAGRKVFTHLRVIITNTTKTIQKKTKGHRKQKTNDTFYVWGNGEIKKE